MWRLQGVHTVKEHRLDVRRCAGEWRRGAGEKGGSSKHRRWGLRQGAARAAHECSLAGSVGMCVGDRDLHGERAPAKIFINLSRKHV